MTGDDGARELVLAWHEALNAGAVDRLVALSCEDIEVGGPRGSGRGTRLLEEWLGRSGIHLHPIRMIDAGDRVIVEQDAIWPGDEQVHRLASVFRIQGSQIASVLRYPDLPTALAAAGLDATGEASAG
jgi:ketosteroid isomerase-like protein